jgi:hypothetical protein
MFVGPALTCLALACADEPNQADSDATVKLLRGFPLAIDPQDSRMKKLLKERANSAAVEFGSRYRECMAGRCTLDTLFGSAGRLLKAKVELPGKPAVLQTHEDYAEFTRKIEGMLKKSMEEGRVPVKEYEYARYMRLDAEITLMRLQEKK